LFRGVEDLFLKFQCWIVGCHGPRSMGIYLVPLCSANRTKALNHLLAVLFEINPDPSHSARG
jgi:hypothetical protein